MRFPGILGRCFLNYYFKKISKNKGGGGRGPPPLDPRLNMLQSLHQVRVRSEIIINTRRDILYINKTIDRSRMGWNIKLEDKS